LKKQEPFAETNGSCFLAPIKGKILFFFLKEKIGMIAGLASEINLE
jgi:hypothetical protein